MKRPNLRLARRGARERDARIEPLLTDEGPHFGSEYQRGGFTVPVFSLPTALMSQALDIFAFDMLIQNPDRRRNKPNLLYDGQRFIVFDHELAFSFLSLIGSIPEPWQLRGQSFVQDHVLYGPLVNYARSHEISFEDFLLRLEQTSDELLSQMVDAIPENWRNPTSAAKIVEHIVRIRENTRRFERGLREALV